MKKLLLLISLLALTTSVYGQNRLVTWSSGQVLTASNLNSEFDNVYQGNISRTGGYWGTNDDIPFSFGSSQDADLEFNTTQTQDALMLWLGGSYTFMISDTNDQATNYALAARTNPSLLVHSADAATAADYIELQHNQTDSVINTGAGGFSLQAAGTEITDVTSAGDWVFKGTTPRLTVGDAGAEDTSIVFDGNAQDYTFGIDDTDDTWQLVLGSTLGTTPIITADSSRNVVISAGSLTASGGGSLTGTWSDLGTVTTVDINGGTIDGTVIGGAATAAGSFTTIVASSTITMSDNQWIGLGASAGRIEFDDQATDEVNILGANVGIGISSSIDGKTHIKAGSTSTVGLVVEALSGASANVQEWHYNGESRQRILLQSGTNEFRVISRDLGNNNVGGGLFSGRNSNSGTEGPAAGYLQLEQADATDTYLWTDNTGVLRIHTAAPTGSSGSPTVSDTAGTVVGDQTSWHELKSNITPFTDYNSALEKVLATDLSTFDMARKDDMMGLVINEEDIGSWYSINDDLSKDQIPALDERTIIGHLIASVKALEARISQLEAQQ